MTKRKRNKLKKHEKPNEDLACAFKYEIFNSDVLQCNLIFIFLSKFEDIRVTYRRQFDVILGPRKY